MNEIDTYNYLGILQCRQSQDSKIKKQLTTVLTITLQKILKTQLNSKNLMKTISTYVIPSLTYSCGISWSQTDLKILARIIRTKMTGACMCNKKSRSERFLLPKNVGSVGIIDMLNLHNNQVKSLRTYFLQKKNLTCIELYMPQFVNYTPQSTWSSATTKCKHWNNARKNNNMAELNPTWKTCLCYWNTRCWYSSIEHVAEGWWTLPRNNWIYDSHPGSGHQ